MQSTDCFHSKETGDLRPEPTGRSTLLSAQSLWLHYIVLGVSLSATHGIVTPGFHPDTHLPVEGGASRRLAKLAPGEMGNGEWGMGKIGEWLGKNAQSM